MARLARIVAPGCPHHVTARGDRREPIVFEDGDQDIYRDRLAEQLDKAGAQAWAYCLTPNHVHLILRLADADGLGQAIGAASRPWSWMRLIRWPPCVMSRSIRCGGGWSKRRGIGPGRVWPRICKARTTPWSGSRLSCRGLSGSLI